MCTNDLINGIVSPFFTNIIANLGENAKILFVALFIGPNGFCLLNVNFYKSEVYSLFKDDGFLHLFAISGSNLILLSSFLGLLLKPFRVFIKTEVIRILLLIFYVVLIVGFDVIPTVRALTTEIIILALKSFGLKIDYKYITLLLFVLFVLIRVENVINKSFLLTFGVLIVSFVSFELLASKYVKSKRSDLFLIKYLYESIFTFFYPLLVINNIDLSMSQIFFSLIVKEILDILAVFFYLLVFTLGMLNGLLSPLIDILVEILVKFLRFINIGILKIEYSNLLVVIALGFVGFLLLASVRKFMRESYLTKYVPVAQLDRARHS